MLNDPLPNALSSIFNRDKIGATSCTIKPISKVIKIVLDLMNKSGYIGTYKEVEDGKGKFIEVNLLGNLNNCKAVTPRFMVKKDGYEKFEKRFLPAKDFGILIVSTNKGIMTHYDAKAKGYGGRLIAFCY